MFKWLQYYQVCEFSNYFKNIYYYLSLFTYVAEKKKTQNPPAS